MCVSTCVAMPRSTRTDLPLVPSHPGSPRDSGQLHSSPLIVHDVVYVRDGRLLAIDLATGERRWRSTVLAGFPVAE